MLKQRISMKIILLCSLVNAILAIGSPRSYLDSQQIRSRGDASCPSCSRDRPDALSSPWHEKPIYEHRFRSGDSRIESEAQPRWNKKYQIQDDSQVFPYPFDRYNRPSRSRGAVYTGTAAATSGDTCKRENPFNLRESEDINSNVAPAPSASPLAFRGPVNLHLPRYGSNFLAEKNGRSLNPYESMSQQRNLQVPTEQLDYFIPNREERRGASSDASGIFRNVYEGNLNGERNKVFVVYRADGRVDGSEERLEEDGTNGFADDHFYRSEASNLERAENILRNPGVEMEQLRRNAFFEQPRRDRSQDSDVLRTSNAVHVPKVKFNPYDSLADLNILRLMQSMQKQKLPFKEREESREESSSLRERGGALEEFEGGPFEGETIHAEENKEAGIVEEASHEDFGADRSPDFATAELEKKFENRNDGFLEEGRVQIMKQEKVVVEEASNAVRTKNQAFGEDGASRSDLGLIEDVENPTVEPTTATILVDSSSEATTMAYRQ